MNSGSEQGNQRNGSAEEARRLLAANPDLVFDERIRIDIGTKDADFWLKFASEWGGALYLLDETNKKRHENGLIDPTSYEYARRTYRLGLITLSELYDKLKAWNGGDERAEPYVYAMNSLDCFFVPAYLEDFSRVQPSLKPACDEAVGRILTQLAGKADLEDVSEALNAMVGQYIRHMHEYAAG
ncbi:MULTISPECIES: hypothetical protein [unclassified Paenibacillus]|uniref:hypothetical protein n=1 Tax=unclassified Paenibacillus TaxID=185978 RepID=UPI0006D1532E|nr:hypothetical protein [Paenibacillus sp. EPM92]